ncbi:Aste57867_5715 [Aphanomyces stellatus]|nr:hypothetical protein As57867_005702 [Aphanomyces stellatus]VFT82752.1 Aste57867_5715 [Aphanomyces stellatus]
MWSLSPPAALTNAVHTIVTSLRQTLTRNAVVENVTAQVAYASLTDGSSGLYPAPQSWIDLGHCTIGGSVLCPQMLVSSCITPALGLKPYLSFSMVCSEYINYITLTPVRQTIVAAITLAGLTNVTTDERNAICVQDPGFYGVCISYLGETALFVQHFMNVSALDALVQHANAAVQAVGFELIQYGAVDMLSPVQLDRLLLFNPLDSRFDMYAWMFMVEWALGIREAVRFEGDHGALTVVTEPLQPLQQEVNVAEFPSSVAFYMRGTVTYVTGIMIALFSLALVYALVSRGYVEVLNLLELQRVGAIVWIGRPILCVRSLTALGMLASATVHLDTTGNISMFTEPPNPWYKTLLSANEVTWLVAIVNDIAMSVTKDYTSYYATINSILVWIIAFVLSYTSPIQHAVEIDKQCHVVHVDFQVECTSAVVQIGAPTRLVTLMCIAWTCNVTCYVVTRIVLGRERLQTNAVHSIFLYAGAKYLFLISPWVHNDIYYMDRMSGLLNGLLTIERENVIYGLDVKLWHMFRIDVHRDATIVATNPMHKASKYAIPLAMT